MTNRYVDQKKNTTGVRGLAAPGRVSPGQPCFVTENRAWRASRRSGRRRSGRRQSPPERYGGIRGSRPLHRPLRCVARPSLSLSRGRPTAPYEGENFKYPEIGRTAPYEGENLFPEAGRTGPCEGETCSRRLGEPRAPASLPFIGVNKRGLPLHRREPVPGGWARTPGPCVSPPHRGEQEGSCGAGSLRFPRRLARTVLSGKQEQRNAKTDPPSRKTLSVRGRPTAPCEEENLFPKVENHTGPCVSPLTGENKRGLAAPGVFDSPIG